MPANFNTLKPAALRVTLAPYRRFKAPTSGHISHYLSHYGLNLVATGAAEHQTIGWFESNRYTLVAQAFFAKNASANAIIVHGYMDHSGLYGALIRLLLSHHVNVYIVDLPGHGLSTGMPASIANFAHYAQAVTQLQQQSLAQSAQGPWYLFGQSMGGAISMLLMQQQRFEIRSAVLLAPLVQPRAWRSLKFLHLALKPFIQAIPRRFTANSHNAEFCDFISRNDPLQTRVIPIKWLSAMHSWRKQFLRSKPCHTPILLIQGSDDQTTDWRYGNRQIVRLFPQHQQVIIPDGRHHLVNESGPYVAKVFAAVEGLLNH